MKTCIGFFKTYFGSIGIGYLYLGLINWAIGDINLKFILIVLLVLNFVACTIYYLGVLIPFYFLLKKRLATLSFKEALHKYLIYFSLVPLALVGLSFYNGIPYSQFGFRISLWAVNISSIIFLGFIHTLKYKTIQ
jgi:hypothetical protein